MGLEPRPLRGETRESIPDIIGTHQNHTAGKMHRKNVDPALDEREYYGASSQRLQAVRPVKKQIEPDWKVRNTFETVGLTPQILDPNMDMRRNEDPRFLKEEQREAVAPGAVLAPQPHAGAIPAPPVYQTIRRKTYEGERNVHHQDSFATVGLTPEMMGIPREYQAGAPKRGKAPVPVNRSAGAPSELVQERRVGKRVTQHGIDQRAKNTFDTAGARHDVHEGRRTDGRAGEGPADAGLAETLPVLNSCPQTVMWIRARGWLFRRRDALRDEEGRRGRPMYIMDIFSRLEEKRSLGSGV